MPPGPAFQPARVPAGPRTCRPAFRPPRVPPAPRPARPASVTRTARHGELQAGPDAHLQRVIQRFHPPRHGAAVVRHGLRGPHGVPGHVLPECALERLPLLEEERALLIGRVLEGDERRVLEVRQDLVERGEWGSESKIKFKK